MSIYLKNWQKVTLFFYAPLLCIILVAAMISPSANQSQVLAASAYLFHPGIGEATIDGNIEPNEWAAADSYSLSMWNWSALEMWGTLYVMQSQTDLYLGFKVDDDELTTDFLYGFWGDTLELWFDDNNSGSLYEVGENKMTLFSASPWYYDMYITTGTGSSALDSSQPGGESNGEGMSGRYEPFNHFEARIPLCSGDAFDFCLSPGDIIGLQVQYNDLFQVGEAIELEAYKYPANELDDLVTIEIIDISQNFLPLIVK